MDLSIEPDLYEPHVGEDGIYTDYLPPSSKFTHGMRCPCGSRKDHIFYNRPSFLSHQKTKIHLKWLADVNANKLNFYTECQELKELVHAQKLIIAQQERDIHTKLNTIAYLTQQLMLLNPTTDTTSTDLLLFD